MDILLDTHVYLWWLDDPEKINLEARELIGNLRNTVYISAAVAWEIAIKKAIGKLHVPDNIMDYVGIEQFVELPITIAHTRELDGLEEIHRDPFDRIMLAQARADNLLSITRDPQSIRYTQVRILPA